MTRYLRDRLDDQTRQFWEGGSWFRQKVVGPRIKFFARNLYDYGSMGHVQPLYPHFDRYEEIGGPGVPERVHP